MDLPMVDEEIPLFRREVKRSLSLPAPEPWLLSDLLPPESISTISRRDVWAPAHEGILSPFPAPAPHLNDKEPWTPLQIRETGTFRNQAANEMSYGSTNALEAIESTCVPSNTSSSLYFSAKSTISGGSIFGETSTKRVTNRRTKEEFTAYKKQLAEKKLWPVDPMLEQNWSGRGQHAEFQKTERKYLNSILKVQDLLGSSSSAVVESVRCKRILLARKKIRCLPGRPITRQMAIEEVAHLTKLQHAHIVRVIGTYVLGQDICILMYPVAQYNLRTYLDEFERFPFARPGVDEYHLFRMMGCIQSALAYVHRAFIKHMDIKPQNILISVPPYDFGDSIPEPKAYLADFGIARAYQNHEATETEGPTMYTRKYAAPEVVNQEKRGLAADIFSLGCVFMEIIARLIEPINSFVWRNSTRLRKTLESNEMGDTSYQANLDSLHKLIENMLEEVAPWAYRELRMIKRMIDRDPARRPPAGELQEVWPPRSCCTQGPEKLEAAPIDDDEGPQATEDTGKRVDLVEQGA